MKLITTLYRDFGDILMNTIGGGIGGAINSGLGGILGMAFQGEQNANQLEQQQKLTNMQLQANESLSAYNYGQQYDMWQKTNYPAQVQELQQAGLNPALLYGKGGGGGTTTGSPTTGAGMGIAPSGNPVAQMSQNTVAGAEAAADINLKNAQAENLKAQTTKTSGVDTTAVQTQIDQMKQLTNNAQIQNGILQWEAGIKSAQATVATQTIDVMINNLTQQNQLLQQQIKSATVSADLSEATKLQLIQQARNATIQQGLQMILTKAQTLGTITDIQSTQNAIQMAVQKNMREWDTMPNMSGQLLQQNLQNELLLQKTTVPEDILKAISHLIIQVK